MASGFNFHPQSDVVIYDIINSLNNSNISSKIIQCAVRILKTAKRSFRISHVHCQLQKDGYNGGVFAIAFARALAFNSLDSTRSQKGACVYLWAKYVDCSYLMDKWIESIESILERRSEPFHHNVDVKCNN